MATAADMAEKVRSALQEELSKASGMKDKEPAKSKEPEAPLLAPKKAKSDGSFKKMFGFEPSIITKATKFKCPEDLKAFVPTPDEDYVLPIEATSVLTYALEEGLFVNMVGPTGSGKSTLAEQVCARLGRPFFRFNGRGDMETASLFGMMVVQDGAPVWKDGTFTEAVKKGATVLFDEYTATPPEINLALQWLREHGGKLLLQDMPGDMSERLITPHPEFRLICADNTRGLGDNGDRFAGTNIQNSASLNRFDITIEHNYMSQKKEAEIITNKYKDVTPPAAAYMVKLATLIRTSYEKGDVSVTLSPRNLLSWAKKACDWDNLETAFMFTYFNMLPTDAEKAAVKGFYLAVFSKELKA